VASLLGVLQRVVVQVDVDHVPTGSLHRLLDRNRHLTRLAVTEADLALAITDDSQRREAELTTTFDNLGDAIDGNQFLNKVIAGLILFVSCHL
jgi:hypothetical protein